MDATVYSHIFLVPRILKLKTQVSYIRAIFHSKT